jgi:beta-N-acetylhexosaminidase
MVGLAGWGVDEATAAHLAAGGQGIILFGANVGSAEQVRSLTREAACAAAGPLLVAVDQELGPVARLRGLVTPLPTTAEAMEMTPLELEITGQLLGDEMLALGINVDLAPVLDVVSGPNPVLEDRHLGADPEVVAELGTAFLRGLETAGVIAVPKHFPGHGRSVTDPHGEATRIAASLEELEAVDFLPFQAAFAAGARAVMVGHPIYAALDPDLPASISPAVLALLRDGFGFGGVAVTDSLSMAGVAAGRDPGSLAVQALAAGEDLLLVVDPSRVEDAVTAIVAAVATGELTLERLQEASSRVRALAAAAAPIPCGA